MKKLLSFSCAGLLLLAFALGCQAATPAFQDFDGSQFGTNGNKVRLKPGVVLTNATVNGGSIHATTALSIPAVLPSANGLGYYQMLLQVPGTTNLYTTAFILINTTNGTLIGSNFTFTGNAAISNNLGVGNTLRINDSAIVLHATGNAEVTGDLAIGGVASGNGAGLTNLVGLTNVSASINVTYNGKVSLVSNLYVLNLHFFTNTMSTITLNAGRSLETLGTNNNITFTGYSGVDGTNGHAFTKIITNTAGPGTPQVITFPVGTKMLSSPWTNVVYNTNQGVFSGMIVPGVVGGTNGTWTGF